MHRRSIAATIAPWLFLALLLFIFSTSSADSGGEEGAAKIESSQISAEELAEELGITTWSFNYSTRLEKVWVEIIDGEDITLIPPNPAVVAKMNATLNVAQKSRNRPTSGRINLFIKPGRIRLRVTGTYSQGGIAGFEEDALWWGWSSYNTVPEKLFEGMEQRPGDECTLLRYKVTNNEVPDGTQSVEVLLKAVLAD